MADPCLESNQWVNLSMSPLSQLQVNLVPSTRSTNSFRLDADGIYVPGFQESTVGPQRDQWGYVAVRVGHEPGCAVGVRVL